MTTERLCLVDPYNKKHREMLKAYDNNFLTNINELINFFSKEEYEKKKIESNEIEETLFLEKDNKITEVCHIHGEKDIKIAKITIIPIKEKEKIKKIISLATNFIFENWNIEEIFIEIDNNDKTIINYLESEEYENLGEERGRILFLKEKQDFKKKGKNIK